VRNCFAALRLPWFAGARPKMLGALIGETAVATIEGLCITWPAAPAESAAAGEERAYPKTS
ncbi:hypothetical protein, partial [uncultured Thiodictyon sp.]|uniref:hypothetical protein n=1 Tax=uncultured Thiodictyon sp. TaxID=1846217 RepID=UPI0025DD218F